MADQLGSKGSSTGSRCRAGLHTPLLPPSFPCSLPSSPSLTQTGVPQFLDMMRKAVFGYSDFLEARRQELGLEKLDNAERMKNLYGVDESTVPESLKQEYLQRQCT